MQSGSVLVAMSGGVDSSVAALLLQRAGYRVVGLTAELYGEASAAGPCCGREGAVSARTVCEVLGIPHHTADLTGPFEQRVIERFIGEYRQGHTPNPCADCNRFIKFEAFFDLAAELGCDSVATGHHARIVQRVGDTDGPPLLATAADNGKDQTYFLACIEPERLSRIRFPVGGYTKAQVRELASAAGLPSATRAESQDICFLNGSVGIRELIHWHTGEEPQPGEIRDEAGRVLGRHPGIAHFTIGQRKGLRLGGGSEGLVVHELIPESNTVVVAQQDAHPVASLTLRSFTDMAPGLWSFGEEVQVRGRYRQPLWSARLETEGSTVEVSPASEQFGLAPGQWLVGYREDVVLFGGIIAEVTHR